MVTVVIETLHDMTETKEYLEERLERTVRERKMFTNAGEELGKKLPGICNEFNVRLVGYITACAVNRGKEERLLKKTLKALDERIKKLKEKEGLE